VIGTAGVGWAVVWAAAVGTVVVGWAAVRTAEVGTVVVGWAAVWVAAVGIMVGECAAAHAREGRVEAGGVSASEEDEAQPVPSEAASQRVAAGPGVDSSFDPPAGVCTVPAHSPLGSL